MARRRAPERKFQIDLWRHVVARLSSDAFAYSVPNEAKRSAHLAALMKASGLTPGVPDLAFVKAGRALFLELKSDSGRLSESQVATHSALRAAGPRSLWRPI